MKRLQILSYILFFGASLYLILGRALSPVEDSYDPGQAALFSAPRERVYPDGRREAVMIAVIVVMILPALVTIVIDWYKKRLEEYRLAAIGCIGIVFGGALTIYFMNIFGGDNYTGLPLCAGLSFLLIMASIAAARFASEAKILESEYMSLDGITEAKEIPGGQAEEVQGKEQNGPAEEKSPVHIDRTIGLQYCLDDELYRQVLESYLEQGQDYKAQLPAYYEAKNWKEYAIVAHAIKSSSLSIGAVILSDLAKEQEFLGKDGNTEEIDKTYEVFYREFCETLVEIEEMLK